MKEELSRIIEMDADDDHLEDIIDYLEQEGLIWSGSL